MRNKAHQVLARCLTQHQRQLFGSLEAVCSGGPAPALILCCHVVTLFIWKQWTLHIHLALIPTNYEGSSNLVSNWLRK